MSDPMAELLIGVDLGTTGTKTALYGKDGTELAAAGADTPLRWHGPGEVDQDPEDFYRTASETIARCVERADATADSVAAIGVTGQMAGVLGIDARWRPSMPYDSWLDLKCSPDVEALEREVGDELIELAGCPAMVNHAPKIRWWRRERPESFDATASFLVPSAYVAGRLAGLDAGDAFVDRSYLHFTGLADAQRGQWSERLAQAVGVPIAKLPRIVEPATVIGSLSADAAGDCGLRRGTPIAAGLGDTAAGVLGAGVVRPGQLLDVAGTAAVLALSTEEHRPDSRSRTLIVMRGAVDGQWVALSYLSGGGLLDWVADTLSGPRAAEGETDYLGLGRAAEGVPPGAEGLVFVPHLDGRLLPSDPELRGAWVGLHRHHRREHLIRSVLESVGYEYSFFLAVMRGLYPELDPAEARVIGGGARSESWCRIKASVLGLPFVRLEREEFSCWGAALVAGAAVGLLSDLAAAAEGATAVRDRFEPDAAAREAYERTEPIYRDALAAVSEPSRALAKGDQGA
jgi:xylulokinase